MTAMDNWMLICMAFVALAQFEYAIQLYIRFGNANMISAVGEKQRTAKTEGKCRKIDQYALRIFLVIYIMTIGAYYYNVRSNASSQ